MNNKLNNQLAQVCNNLYCLLRQANQYYANLSAYTPTMYAVCRELEAEYNTLFKLVYGNE